MISIFWKKYFKGISFGKLITQFRMVRILIFSIIILTYVLSKQGCDSHAKLNSNSILSAYERINNAYKKHNNHSQAKCYESVCEKGKKEISQEEFSDQDNIDWDYIKHLDLAIGAVALSSGVVRNLRFNNGYIKNIFIQTLEYSNIDIRIWNKDSGEGFANVMTYLFPSISGELSVESTSNDCLSGAASPDPKTIAQLIEVIYYMRDNPDSKLCDNKKNEFKQSVRSNLLKLNPNKKTISKNIQKINSFFNNIKIVIQSQESNLENPGIQSDKALPKYTLERMILAYFVEHFNSIDDVDQFYNELIPRITHKKSISNIVLKEDDNTLDSLNKLHEVYKLSSSSVSTPYTEGLLTEGDCYPVLLMEDGNCVIDSTKIFFDCVETSIRHVVNLLTYDYKNKTFLFSEIKEDNKQKNNLINDFNSSRGIRFMDLRDRIRLFYFYQTPDKTNDGHKEIRSLWNYAMSNMSSDDRGLYPLNYKRNNSNELKAGLINSLKTLYNIAISIRGEECCTKAKKSIEDLQRMLIEKKSIEEINRGLEYAAEKTLKLINPSYTIRVKHISNIRVQNLSSKNIDLLGSLKVCVYSKEPKEMIFEFILKQENYHGETQHYLKRKLNLTEDEKERYLDNKDARLLFVSSNDDTVLENELRTFDLVFLKIKKGMFNEKNKFYNIAYALNLYGTAELINYHNMFNFLKKYKIKLVDISDVNIRINKQKKEYKSLDRLITDKINQNPSEFAKSYVINNLVSDSDNDKYNDSVIETNFPNILKRTKKIIESFSDSENSSDMNISNQISSYMFSIIGKQSMMAKIIKDYNYEAFSKIISCLEKNKLLYEYVYSEKIDNFNILYMNSLEYAVKLESWEKVKKITELLNEIELSRLVFYDDYGKYTAVGFLIKKGQSSIVEENLNKFRLNFMVYEDNWGKKYSAYEYVSDILKDKGIEKRINPNRKIKKNLMNRKELTLKNFLQLTIYDIFKIQDDISIMAIAVDSLNLKEIVFLVKSLNIKLQDTTVFLSKGQRFDILSYTIEKGYWDKAREIAKHLRLINNYYYYNFSGYEGRYTVLGILLKNKKIDIIKENKKKFNFNSNVYMDKDDLEHSGYDFVYKTLNDEKLLLDLYLGITLSENGELTLENISKLPKISILAVCCNRSSILAIAVDKLNESDFGKLIDMLGINNYNNSVINVNGSYLNMFEYAVGKEEWGKVNIIIEKRSRTFICNSLLFEDGNSQYSTLGRLLKCGRWKIIKDNIGKFDFMDIAYKDEYGKEYSGYEYISDIIKNKELEKRLNPNKEIRENILSGVNFTIENLLKLQKQDIMKIQNNNYSILAMAIERLDSDDLEILIKSVELKDFQYVISTNDKYLSAFEYAVSLFKWENARVILNNLYELYNYNYIENNDNGQYTALGILLRENKYEVIDANLPRLSLDVWVYKDKEGCEYSFEQYVEKVLKNVEIQDKLDPNKKLKEELRNGKNLTLENLDKLSIKEIFYCKAMNKSIMAFAIDNLNAGDLEKLLNKLKIKNYHYKLQYISKCNGKLLNIFEYAVLEKQWEKVEKIIQNMDGIYSSSFILCDKWSRYTALGILLKEGKCNLVIENLSKFNINALVLEDMYGYFYSAETYIKKMIHAKQIHKPFPEYCTNKIT